MSQITLEKRRPRSRDGLVSYAEFLASEHENAHVEWVDGRVEAIVPISEDHQDIGASLISWLKAFVEQTRSGEIRYEPFQMKTGPDLPGRAPDILFVSSVNRSRLKKTHLSGPADLVIEIISSESRGRDRGDKFYEYEKGGVTEYWLIDPERKQVEFYLLRRRRYKLAELDAKGIFHSTVLPGVWINAAWFWTKPLPSVISILRNWKLIK
jgi:Uma2 family endonuclease